MVIVLLIYNPYPLFFYNASLVVGDCIPVENNSENAENFAYDEEVIRTWAGVPVYFIQINLVRES